MEEHDCEMCGTNVGVEYVIDPYDHDVNNTKTWRWLCDNCEGELAMEI